MHSQSIVHLDTAILKDTQKSENYYPPNYHVNIFDNFLKFDNSFMSIFSQPALRTEARIMMLISNNKSYSVKEILNDSHTSSRNFYTLLGKMKKDKMIVSINDNDDLRVKRLQINHDFLETITSLLV